MRSILFLLSLVVFCSFSAEAQLFRKNRNDNASKNGKYYEFWDKDSTTLSAKGHFCHDLPCKTWKYYYSDGTRRMKVKYRDSLKIKYYTNSGKLDQKGYAMLNLNTENIHFYWHGIWKFYDHKRKLYRIALYENGAEVEVLSGPEEPIYFE
ncbi:MAG: hypothetical protein K8R63_10815 [Bacteroidales bacterium]|nr:hypothetical protein [Bacteroidales bacterium]